MTLDQVDKTFMEMFGDVEIGPQRKANVSFLREAKNPIVIYHGGCADGFGAAWCFHHFCTKNNIGIDYYAGVYNRPPPDTSDREVFLVDFSYKKDVILKMLQTANRVVLIDHHKTALDDLKDVRHPNFSVYTDLYRSGAVLAWDFLFPGSVRPSVLEHIQDRDLWKFELPNTKEIMAAVFSYDQDFEVWGKLMTYNEASIYTLYHEGITLLRKNQKDVTSVIQSSLRYQVINDITVPVVNCPYFLASDIGDILSKDHSFVALYYDTAQARKFSLRSSKEGGADVSLIASKFGGGGHKNAAGFEVPRNHPLAQF